ncbi:hypothetical protein SHO565_66300 [Streptomyces sp. HO565]
MSEAAQEVLVLGDDRRQELLDCGVPPLVESEIDPAHATGPEAPEQGDRSDPSWILVLQRPGSAAREAESGFPVHALPVHRPAGPDPWPYVPPRVVRTDTGPAKGPVCTIAAPD